MSLAGIEKIPFFANNVWGVGLAIWAIVGPGAVGVGVAHALGLAQAEVQFVGRLGPRTMHVAMQDGAGLDICLTTGSLDMSAVAGVFFAVKAYDLETALRQHLAKLPTGIPVIPLVNGAIDTILTNVAKLHPRFAWRLGVTTLGVTVRRGGGFRLASEHGEIQWGAMPGMHAKKITPAETALMNASKTFQWRDDIFDVYRQKWLFNVVMNSLAATQRLACNGNLRRHLPRVEEVFSEAWSLSERLWGKNSVEPSQAFANLLKLIDATADNENSMARDVRLGRRTESVYLAGKALAFGAEYPKLCDLHAQLGSG